MHLETSLSHLTVYTSSFGHGSRPIQSELTLKPILALISMYEMKKQLFTVSPNAAALP